MVFPVSPTNKYCLHFVTKFINTKLSDHYVLKTPIILFIYDLNL
jgi:hypothetical protein